MRVVRAVVVSAVVALAAAAVAAAAASSPAPAQPIPFSHRVHATDAAIGCTACHVYAERGPVAGIPSMARCQGCHKFVKEDPAHPEIARELKPLLQILRDKTAVEWVRVHRLPDHVFFTHERHVRAGLRCQQCHGGDRVGGPHGSSRRKYPYRYDPSTNLSSQNTFTTVPASFSGKRMLNGAYWYGVTRATTSSGAGTRPRCSPACPRATASDRVMVPPPLTVGRWHGPRLGVRSDAWRLHGDGCLDLGPGGHLDACQIRLGDEVANAGHPAEAVRLSIAPPESWSAPGGAAQSDAVGEFAFTAVPPGQWRIGATVLMLRVIETHDRNQQWLGVADIMRAEAHEEANAVLDRHAIRSSSITGVMPQRVIREGEKAQEVLNLIKDDEDIAILVLAADTGKEGPGPLVSSVCKNAGDFPIPVAIVPAHLSDEDLDAMS